MGTQPTVVHDVGDFDTAHEHEVVGQQTTMATPPQRLAAHHGRRRSHPRRPEVRPPLSGRARSPCSRRRPGTPRCAARRAWTRRLADGVRQVRESTRSRGPPAGPSAPSPHGRTAGCAGCPGTTAHRRRMRRRLRRSNDTKASAARVPCPTVRTAVTAILGSFAHSRSHRTETVGLRQTCRRATRSRRVAVRRESLVARGRNTGAELAETMMGR